MNIIQHTKRFIQYIKRSRKTFNDRTLKIKLDKIVSIEHFKAIRNFKFLKEIEYVGFHGQTIYHNQTKIDVQLGILNC